MKSVEELAEEIEATRDFQLDTVTERLFAFEKLIKARDAEWEAEKPKTKDIYQDFKTIMGEGIKQEIDEAVAKTLAEERKKWEEQKIICDICNEQEILFNRCGTCLNEEKRRFEVDILEARNKEIRKALDDTYVALFDGFDDNRLSEAQMQVIDLAFNKLKQKLGVESA